MPMTAPKDLDRLRADIVLNNSLAFGGYNSVTCLAKPGKLPDPADVAPRSLRSRRDRAQSKDVPS